MFAEITLAIAVFTGTVLLLVAVILLARQRLVPSGDVRLEVNGQRTLLVPVGGKLLQTLASQNLFLSSACGGGGTCAQCKCLVEAGGGDMTPTERGHFTRRQEREGWRLSCQLPVRQDMSIRVPESVFGVRRWDCRVIANDNVATFIKELTLAMPDGEAVSFRAGSYMQLECPPHEQRYADIDVAPEYREDWDRLDLWRYVSHVGESTIRAYSMANYPQEKGLGFSQDCAWEKRFSCGEQPRTELSEWCGPDAMGWVFVMVRRPCEGCHTQGWFRANRGSRLAGRKKRIPFAPRLSKDDGIFRCPPRFLR